MSRRALDTNAAITDIVDDIYRFTAKAILLLQLVERENPKLANDTLTEVVRFFGDIFPSESVDENRIFHLRDNSDDNNNLEEDVSVNINDLIIELCRESEIPLSVQQLSDYAEKADFHISRQNLVVKLHRMVKNGDLVSPSTGHFSATDDAPVVRRRTRRS